MEIDAGFFMTLNGQPAGSETAPMLLVAPLTLAATEEPQYYRANLCAVGPIRNVLDEDTAIIITEEALKDGLERGLFSGLAAFVDHLGWLDSQSSIRDLLGAWIDPAFDDDDKAIAATLRTYPNAETQPAIDRIDQIIADAKAGISIPDTGISLVFYGEWYARESNAEPLRLKRFRQITSADYVFFPAVRSARIKNSLSGGSKMNEMTKEVPNTDSAADAPAPATLTAPAPPAPVQPAGNNDGAAVNAWLDSAQQFAMTQMLSASGLPTATRQRLAGGTYASPEELKAAIEAARTELAALSEDATVQLAGPAPRATQMRTGGDDLEGAVEWIFGVSDAQLPPPSLRNTRDLYILATGDVHWRGIFDRDSGYALAAATPTTLPGLAVNAMNKVMVELYDNLWVYRWFEQIVAVQPNDGSLHDMSWIQFGGISNLPIVDDGEAYPEASVADSRESDAFVKHGNYVGVTRKMLRNSMIAQLRAIPRALVTAAVRTRSANIASIFTDNSGVGPTLDQDSTALFHSNHGNVATTDFSQTAWKAARLECFKQTELGSSKRQGLWPKFWLGPADLYDDALVTFGYGAGNVGRPASAATAQEVNLYAESRPGDPRPAPLAVPEFTDANDWAYLADPMMAPIIQMSYSQNPGGNVHPLPELFSVVSETAGLMFTNDTMPIKVRDEYAYGVATYRGIGKRNVVA